jgi:hypothetical protein
MWLQASLTVLIFSGQTISVASGALAPNQQEIYRLPAAQVDVPINIQVDGHDADGDIDCYVVSNHHFIAMREDDRNGCHMTVFPRTHDPLKLVVVNHGDKSTAFRLLVDQ